ncbi:MAG: hypothetical protein AAF490_24900 [Chloroflexota bacterium]
MGLIARALELEGIATTLTAWNAGIIRLVNPPRGTITQLERGQTVGKPGDIAQQQRILLTTLNLLEQNAPIPLKRLKES